MQAMHVRANKQNFAESMQVSNATLKCTVKFQRLTTFYLSRKKFYFYLSRFLRSLLLLLLK